MCRDLSSNDLTGGFPTNWGNQNAMQQLESLSLSNNPRLGGSLQSSWGQVRSQLCHSLYAVALVEVPLTRVAQSKSQVMSMSHEGRFQRKLGVAADAN